jgi:uncharacterized tellurite resistance protein B-like protein
LIKRLLKYFEVSSQKEDDVDSSHSIQVAALALLIEVANADHTLTDSEREKIIALAGTLFKLDETEKEMIVELAYSKSDQSTSLFEYTTVVNKHFSEQEKFNLIFSMWQVALADDSIDSYEDHLIRRVSDLVYLPHVRFIEAKHHALDLK